MSYILGSKDTHSNIEAFRNVILGVTTRGDVDIIDVIIYFSPAIESSMTNARCVVWVSFTYSTNIQQAFMSMPFYTSNIATNYSTSVPSTVWPRPKDYALWPCAKHTSHLLGSVVLTGMCVILSIDFSYFRNILKCVVYYLSILGIINVMVFCRFSCCIIRFDPIINLDGKQLSDYYFPDFHQSLS